MKARDNGFVDSVLAFCLRPPRRASTSVASTLPTRPEAESRAEKVQTDEEHDAANAEWIGQHISGEAEHRLRHGPDRSIASRMAS